MGKPTTTVNLMTVVHKKSGGISIAFPDVCKTPSPAGGVPVPIPYVNIAFSKDTANGSTTVKVDGNPIMLRGSNFSTSTGDEPGSVGGIVSNIIKGKATPLTYSFDVMVDGDFVFRQFDMMLQNSNPPPNTPPGIELQAPLFVLPPWLTLPNWKVEWSQTQLKCGDDVEIRVTDQGGGSGHYASITVARAPWHLPVSYFVSLISGVTRIPWVTKTGPYPRNQVQLDIFAFGAGVYATSGSPLMITVPEDVRRPWPNLPPRSVPQVTFVQNPDGSYTYTPVGPGFNWGWDYGYDLEIKDGVFRVTCKLKLTPCGGASFGAITKWWWKREIESFWTRKWKEHRTACRRGAGCRCFGGCCLFPIEFECLFVDSGHFAEVEVWAGNPCTYGMDASGDHNKWWNSGTFFMETCGHEGNGAAVRAHEFGHEMGLYDEYREGGIYVPTDASGNVSGPPPTPEVEGSIMQSGTSVNRNHLDEFHAWFLSVANDAYEPERL